LWPVTTAAGLSAARWSTYYGAEVTDAAALM